MIKMILVLSLMLCSITFVQNKSLWECNYCHQQYFGDAPPRFVKCPARDNKVNHWWIRK